MTRNIPVKCVDRAFLLVLGSDSVTKPLAADIDKHIGKRLQHFRQLAGLSAANLAEAIGSTQQQVSRYENGQNKLSASQLYRIAACLGVPINWFFQELEDPGVPLLAPEGEAHERGMIKQELDTIEVLWPKLDQKQRAAMLKLLDTFLV